MFAIVSDRVCLCLCVSLCARACDFVCACVYLRFACALACTCECDCVCALFFFRVRACLLFFIHDCLFASVYMTSSCDRVCVRTCV